MSNIPPMSVRNFRDYFMIEDEPETHADYDPYERCDIEEDGGDDE